MNAVGIKGFCRSIGLFVSEFVPDSYLDLFHWVSPAFLFCNIIIRQLMRFFKSSLAETGTKIDVPCRQTVIIMPSYAGVTSRCASWRSSSAWLPCSVLAMCEV